MQGGKWSREETILAFELYCRTSFGKISKKNKEVIALAKIIGRTPSAVALKMHNLASYDPSLISRGVHGMKHSSKLDGEIWEEFAGDWEALSYEGKKILSQVGALSDNKLRESFMFDGIPEGREREALYKQRIGQSFFRDAVLNSYDNRCCITGIKKPEMLIASHIKPWSESDSRTERANPSNGLCLNPFHDKAFDKGLITITLSYKVRISEQLKNAVMDEQTKKWLEYYEGNKIMLPLKFLPMKEFLEYHNDVIFQT